MSWRKSVIPFLKAIAQQETMMTARSFLSFSLSALIMSTAAPLITIMSYRTGSPTSTS